MKRASRTYSWADNGNLPKFLGSGNHFGIHFGLWGLAVNFIVFRIASMLSREDPGFEEFSKGLKEKEEGA